MAFQRCIIRGLLVLVIGFLLTCNVSMDVPNYYIDIHTSKIAYQDPSNIPVQFKFIAEEDQHRCRFELSNGSGNEMDSTFEVLSANVLYERILDLTPYGGIDGKYDYRLIVQSEMPDGSFVDFKFLDATSEFYIDNLPPGPANINPQPLLLNESVEVELSHDDNSDPNKSPVMLYYTTDETVPTIASKKYSGPFVIELPDTGGTVEVKVLPVDSVPLSGSIDSFIYKFLDLKNVTESGPVNPDLVIKIGEANNKALHGFGFSAVVDVASEVFVVDHDDTSLTTVGIVWSDELISLTAYADFPPKEDPNDTGFEPGPGKIIVMDNDSGVSDFYDITIE